jgi:hypothetical protein
MINRSRQRINELRREPEDIRLRAALKLVATIGLIIALIAIVLLLPIQAYLTTRIV